MVGAFSFLSFLLQACPATTSHSILRSRKNDAPRNSLVGMREYSACSMWVKSCAISLASKSSRLFPGHAVRSTMGRRATGFAAHSFRQRNVAEEFCGAHRRGDPTKVTLSMENLCKTKLRGETSPGLRAPAGHSLPVANRCCRCCRRSHPKTWTVPANFLSPKPPPADLQTSRSSSSAAKSVE